MLKKQVNKRQMGQTMGESPFEPLASTLRSPSTAYFTTSSNHLLREAFLRRICTRFRTSGETEFDFEWPSRRSIESNNALPSLKMEAGLEASGEGKREIKEAKFRGSCGDEEGCGAFWESEESGGGNWGFAWGTWASSRDIIV